MAARYAAARHSGERDAWGYGPAPGRADAPQQRASPHQPQPLPDLAEVARRLAASHFVCVAACHVMKPPSDDGHGGHLAGDVRVLAVGYAAGSASSPELLKISSTPAFSLLRSWKRRVAARAFHARRRALTRGQPLLRAASRAAWWRARRPRSVAWGRCA